MIHHTIVTVPRWTRSPEGRLVEGAGVQDVEIEIHLQLDNLAIHLARKAAKNRSGRSKIQGGLIAARITRRA